MIPDPVSPTTPAPPLSPQRRAVHRALQRGQSQGLPETAVYQPGEEVRCLCLSNRKREAHGLVVCGMYLFTLGPESIAHVKVYEARAFHERRRAPRGNFRCPHPECRGSLEIETHLVPTSGSEAA